jgi:hypothetical protein
LKEKKISIFAEIFDNKVKINQNIQTVIIEKVESDSTSYIYSTSYKTSSESLKRILNFKDEKSDNEETNGNYTSLKTDNTSYVYYNVYDKPLLGKNKVITSLATVNNETVLRQKQKEEYNSFVIFFIFIFGLIILTLSKVYYKNYIKNIFTSSYNYRSSISFQRDNTKTPKMIRHLHNLNYIISFSSFITISIIKLNIIPIINILGLIFAISIILFLLFSFHKIINFIVGNLFYTTSVSSEYNFNLSIFNQMTGIIFIPVLLAISFSGFPIFFIITGISTYFIILIMRILRLLKINFENNISLFYLFLYLCTLEIIPILVLYKVFKIVFYSSL